MTSKSYIEMCDNPDLQGIWELKEGDYVYMPDKETPEIELFSWADADAWETKELQKEHNAIWLPTHEQLWGMLPNHLHCKVTRHKGFYVGEENLADWGKKGEAAIFQSYCLEEVLIQMVMSVIFNKRWQSGKWVNV